MGYGLPGIPIIFAEYILEFFSLKSQCTFPKGILTVSMSE